MNVRYTDRTNNSVRHNGDGDLYSRGIFVQGPKEGCSRIERFSATRLRDTGTGSGRYPNTSEPRSLLKIRLAAATWPRLIHAAQKQPNNRGKRILVRFRKNITPEEVLEGLRSREEFQSRIRHFWRMFLRLNLNFARLGFRACRNLCSEGVEFPIFQVANINSIKPEIVGSSTLPGLNLHLKSLFKPGVRRLKLY